jgi:serine/threonine-protein kinase
VDPSTDIGCLPWVDPLGPGSIVGEYRVVQKLGEGGMAAVYGAVHPVIGKRAAIKVMSPRLSGDAGSVSRFMLEARAVNCIGHPNIVDVFGFGRLPDGRSYFIMEWLRGETLYERMWRHHRPLQLPEIIHILDRICDALEAAHHEGIVHRDLKPANVFLCNVCGRGLEVKLLDFGVAKLTHQERLPHQTAVGCVVGTPEYVSPEQARGREIDGRSDLYSLGVIAYEMVLGRLPFLADNPADAIQMHLCAAPPRPRILWRHIPPPLEQLLLALLAKDAARRPSVLAVRATLAALRATMTPAPGRAATTARLVCRRRRRRRHLLRLGAVAATFALLVCLGYWPRRPSRSRGAPASTIVSPPEAQAEVTVAAQAEVTAAAQAEVTAATQAEVTVATQAELTAATQAEVTSAARAEAAVPARAPAALKPPPATETRLQRAGERGHRPVRRRFRDDDYLLDPFVK